MSEAVPTEQAADPEWDDIFAEPFVVLVAGKRGGGKTATGHRLLEVFGEDTDRDAYIMGFPEDKRDLLPEWIDVLPQGVGMDNWPEDSVVLVHEAHHVLHARRSMDGENLEVDKLVTVSRHRNSDIILETQQTFRLDKNFVAAVDGIVMKMPALMQADFERKQMRKIVREAEDVLDDYITVHDGEDYTWIERDDDLVKHAYVYSQRFQGKYPYPIALADHWTEDISKVYGDGGVVEPDGESGGATDSDRLSDEERTVLNEAAEWEQEHRPLDRSSHGFTHENSDLSYAWNQITSLREKGLLEKVFKTNSTSTRCRLTDEGWDVADATEPDGPVVAEE